MVIGVLLISACQKKSDAWHAWSRGDFDSAFNIHVERSEAGNTEAINFLGVHYYLGLGVTRDFKTAEFYFRKAALLNHANAQRNLGIMLYRGLGVEQDFERAYGWFSQSYLQGNPNSKAYLRMLSNRVTPNAGVRAHERTMAEIRAFEQNRER